MELSRLLIETLTGQGFEVNDPGAVEGRSGTSYAVSLVATTGDRRFLVDVLLTRPVGSTDLTALQAIAEDTDHDGVLLFALEGLRPGAAATGAVTVLDREAIETAIGQALLSRALDEMDLPEEELTPAAPVSLDLQVHPPALLDAKQAPEPEQALPADEPAPVAASGPPAQRQADAADQPDPEPVAAQPAPADDGSDAEWLPGRTNAAPAQPQAPEPTPEATTTPSAGPSPTPAAAADAGDGRPPPTPDQLLQEVADDGSDAEWLDSGRASAAGAASPTAPETEPTAASPSQESHTPAPEEVAPNPGAIDLPESDAMWLPSKPRNAGVETRSEPTSAGQAPAAPARPAPRPPVADKTDGDASWLPTRPRGTTPRAEERVAGSPSPARSPSIDRVIHEPSGDAAWMPSKPRIVRPWDPPEAQPAVPVERPTPPPNTQPPLVPEPPVAPTKSEATPAAAPGSPARDSDLLSGRCLEPRLDAHEARRVAEGALFSTRAAELELLPFHVYQYRCTLAGGKVSRDEEGEVWVSAQTGVPAAAPDAVVVEELAVPFQRIEPEISKERAAQAATEHLGEELEVREEVRKDYGESAVIDRVTLRPMDGTLQLQYAGLAYAPRWRIEGQNGVTYVDAVTGEMVSPR